MTVEAATVKVSRFLKSKPPAALTVSSLILKVTESAASAPIEKAPFISRLSAVETEKVSPPPASEAPI